MNQTFFESKDFLFIYFELNELNKLLSKQRYVFF